MGEAVTRGKRRTGEHLPQSSLKPLEMPLSKMNELCAKKAATSCVTQILGVVGNSLIKWGETDAVFWGNCLIVYFDSSKDASWCTERIANNYRSLWSIIFEKNKIDYTSQHWIEPFATGKIRQNIKFADFWCVFLTKIKVDPESWCKKLSIKQLRKKKITKDDFIWSRSRIKLLDFRAIWMFILQVPPTSLIHKMATKDHCRANSS